MSFIKEFKQFALRGNLVDIAVAFVIGGAFGKVVSTFTEKLIAPLIGLLTGGTNFYDKKLVPKSEINEVVDPSGKVVIPHGAEVAIEWGAFVTVVIDFIIVAFAMFLIIKGINALKKKEELSAPEVSKTDQLLTEIRDSLKK
ncbi:MAG: large conductance mechanosensitive channel protein MscL [Bacteroidetes bacterium]|nr:large conductance mechanosensitive channel protein MscL [Bacteroidota bacterium]